MTPTTAKTLEKGGLGSWEHLGIDTPPVKTSFDGGLLSGIASFLWLFFVVLMIIWVGYTLFAAYKIIKSQGDPGAIQQGMKWIKNVWISITVGVIFFIVLSVAGTFFGVGSIAQWHYQLSQCHDSSGGFYFKDIAMQAGEEKVEYKDVRCCKVTGEIKGTGFKAGEWHFLIPGNSGSDCVDMDGNKVN